MPKKSKLPDKVQQEMTPMIDVVFQLLTFFIMTFKTGGGEGDFNIKMPLAAAAPGIPKDDMVPPIKIRIKAAGSGKMDNISVNDKSYGVEWKSVHQFIIGLVGDERGPNPARENTEVELDCDFNLNYEHVIEAITQVSGYVDPSSKTIVKLVEKVKFSPPKSG